MYIVLYTHADQYILSNCNVYKRTTNVNTHTQIQQKHICNTRKHKTHTQHL